MTREDLGRFFKEHLVPEKFYKIGGKHNNRICMEKTENGWDVYFSEKKDKVGVIHYNDEASACKGMKNEVRKLMELIYGLTWVEDR